MTPFNAVDFDQHESVHFFKDAESGLEAIVAIHNTALGPAAGGCRYWQYGSGDAALTDALRLSRGMSFKNALAGLPLGGGKAVILKSAVEARRGDLFEAFGRAVDSLGGRYVTAEDVGTTVADMKAIAGVTRFVSGIAEDKGTAGGDPSPKTARGVFLALKEGWHHLTGRTDLHGVRVAVQGLGGVGYHLCQYLHAEQAKLLVADLQDIRVQRARDELGAEAVISAEILSAPADIVAPCALGAVLNEQSIPSISARLIAGGANNQLATRADGERLRARGILYAPDYVINSGGIICVASEYLGQDSEADVMRRIERIPTTLRKILHKAAADAQPTNVVADRLAEEVLSAARHRTQRSAA